MRGRVAAWGALALVAAPVGAQDDPDGAARITVRAPAVARAFAQPSDVVATEIAFARAARAKGQWPAFRAFAAPGAEMFAGAAPVRVAAWTEGRANPATVLAWSPTLVWISCDGSYALSYGGWTAGKDHGWFATIWQRQKKGAWRFVLDQGGDLAAPLADADMIAAHVAACPARAHSEGHTDHHYATVRDEIDAGHAGDEDAPDAPRKHRKDKGPPDPNAADAKAALVADWTHGVARDHTLDWATTFAGGTRTLVVRVKDAAGWREALRVSAAAGG